MIHLVCGPIGAGKTTHAIEIAKLNRAIRFSEDEWLNKLFVPDAPEGLLDQPMDVIGPWAFEKYQRCRGQIWLVCQQLLVQGQSVVLDGAAATLEQRNAMREKAKKYNVEFKLHYVTADLATRKQRVANRNIDQGDTFSLQVPTHMFDAMEAHFEVPTSKELENANVILN